jgi:hypothetical protein
MIHGSGGVGAVVDHWSQELLSMGVATFVVDSFTGRGITQVRDDQDRLGGLTTIVDAYRALQLPAKHPRVDASRIGRMGFSRGGHAAVEVDGSPPHTVPFRSAGRGSVNRVLAERITGSQGRWKGTRIFLRRPRAVLERHGSRSRLQRAVDGCRASLKRRPGQAKSIAAMRCSAVPTARAYFLRFVFRACALVGQLQENVIKIRHI